VRRLAFWTDAGDYHMSFRLKVCERTIRALPRGTIGGCIIKEVYYPRVDIPQIRGLGFVVEIDEVLGGK